jgi:hypothetical protein
MKVRVLINERKKCPRAFRQRLLKYWRDFFHKEDSYCLVKNCGEMNNLTAALVNNENDEVGIVPMCTKHALKSGEVELEYYAHVLSAKEIEDDIPVKLRHLFLPNE